MRISQQQYREIPDQAAMAALVQAYPTDHQHIVDLPYRLCSWALDDPKNVGLWTDEQGRLVAWAVMQLPFWTIDYALHPQADPGLHRQVLAWADRRANELLGTPHGHPMWFINVFADLPGRIADLEAAGFRSQVDVGEDSWSKVFLRRPGGLPVREYHLPPGFTLRPLDGEAEVEAYVELHRTVFESKNMTVAWRRRTLQHPDYVPELDLVVAALDGRLAAFCIGWLCRTGDRRSPRGQIEPLGCHPDFRRYALGRLALAEALRRLQAQGAEHIYVETDNYRNTARDLYESLGFQVIRDILVFRKDY